MWESTAEHKSYLKFGSRIVPYCAHIDGFKDAISSLARDSFLDFLLFACSKLFISLCLVTV